MKTLISIIAVLVAVGCSNEIQMVEDANTMLQTELQKSKTENKKLQSENKRLEAELKEEKRKLGVAEKIKNMREKGAKTETVLIGGKEDSLKLSVDGTYERIDPLGGFTVKQVFLENGKFESYVNGENSLMDGTWKIAGKEVYVERKVSPTNPLGTGIVFNIEPDGDLTLNAEIKYGKRSSTRPI